MAHDPTIGQVDRVQGSYETSVPGGGNRSAGYWARIAGLRKQLAAASVNRQIFSAAIAIGVLTTVAKLVGMGKEMLVAAWFGTGNALDAFLLALLIPSYAINVIAGSVHAALIPTYVEVHEKEGQQAAQRLFSGTIVFSTTLLTLAGLVLAAVAPVALPLLGSGFGPEKMDLALKLFYVLLPGILLAGLAITCEAVLNANERFALAAIAPSVVPLLVIALLLTCGTRFGVSAIAVGTTVGFLIELAVAVWSLQKRGLSFIPRWSRGNPAVQQVMRQYFQTVVASALMCSSMLIDQAMASTLPAGSISALNYGNKIVALGLTVGTMAFGTAALPYLSKMSAAQDWAGLRHTLNTYLKMIVVTTVPLVAVGTVLSKPVVALLFQRGNFTEADTALVAWVQSMYLLQVPFYSIIILFVRVISSLQANELLMWGTVISTVLNVVANYVLMQRMGDAGIALSTSIVHAVLAGFLGLVLWRKLRAVSVKVPCE